MPPEFTVSLIRTSTLNVSVLSSPGVFIIKWSRPLPIVWKYFRSEPLAFQPLAAWGFALWLSLSHQRSLLWLPHTQSEVAQSCLTLRDPMDCSLPGSSVHGIFQAIVLERIPISFSRGSSRPRNRTQVFHIVDRRFTIWATREVLPSHPSDACWWGCSLDWESSPLNFFKKKFPFLIMTITVMLRRSYKEHAQHTTFLLYPPSSFVSPPPSLHQQLSCWHLKN